MPIVELDCRRLVASQPFLPGLISMRCSSCHYTDVPPGEVCPACGSRQGGPPTAFAPPDKPAMLETFGRAAGFLVMHLGTLAPIILTLTMPVELARSYLMLQTELLQSRGLNLLIQYGTELPFHALVEPAFFMAVFALPTGRRLTVLDAYGEALRWWPRMFGVYVKLWVLTMLGFLLFVIPAIWIMVVFAFADLAALLDPERQRNPFSTSNRLVAGLQLRILGVVLLQLAASVLFEQLLRLNPALLQVWWARALAGSAFAVVVRWFSIVLVFFYVRARLARNEEVPSFEELFPRLAQRYAGVPGQ